MKRVEKLNFGKLLKEIAKNKEGRKCLRGCYEQLKTEMELKNFNNTSLVMFHIPWMAFGKQNYLSQCFVRNKTCYSVFLYHPLGDIEFSQSEIYEEFKKHYSGLLEKVCMFQIPHHGSKNNWNNSIIRDTKCNFWVVSSKIGNPKHPSLEVIKEIVERGRFLLWANEENFVNLRLKLWYPI